MNAPIALREESEANQVESRVSPVNRPTGKLFQPSGQLRLVPALGKARPSLCKTLPSQLRDPVASQMVGILACWLATVVYPLGNSVCLGLSTHGASIAGSSKPAICHCHNLIYSITHLSPLPDNMQISANLLHQFAYLSNTASFQYLMS